MKAKNLLKEVENEILGEKKKALKQMLKEKLEEIDKAKRKLKKKEKDLKEFLELDIDDVEIPEESDGFATGSSTFINGWHKIYEPPNKPERYKTWITTTSSGTSGTTIMYGGA